MKTAPTPATPSSPADSGDWLPRRLLAWFARHGRSDLPWQHNPTPYRVWVSEIMLQQTQVSTVIPYYQRFMAQFPEVAALAAAPLDKVLNLWTGLGYYARARNLHRSAQLVCNEYGAVLPDSVDALQSLPGIGRSTAAAILALSRGQRETILDGNVKRVLARVHAVDGWPGRRAVEQRLWDYAERHTPTQQVAAYTQAIMDLGATVCTRGTPACPQCPLQAGCEAYRLQRQQDFPTPRPKKTLPQRTTTLLLLANSDDTVLLEQRPPAGLWGGLLCLPEVPEAARGSAAAIRAWCRTQLHCDIAIERHWPTFRHTFSHFHLDITPVVARLRAPTNGVMERPNLIWYNSAQQSHGLAAPIQRLLDRYRQQRLEQQGDP